MSDLVTDSVLPPAKRTLAAAEQESDNHESESRRVNPSLVTHAPMAPRVNPFADSGPARALKTAVDRDAETIYNNGVQNLNITNGDANDVDDYDAFRHTSFNYQNHVTVTRNRNHSSGSEDDGIAEAPVFDVDDIDDDLDWGPGLGTGTHWTTTTSDLTAENLHRTNGKRDVSPFSSPELDRKNSFVSSFGRTESSYAKPGVCGLSNLGNTCFMNAGLQCLFAIPDLVEYFTKGRYLEDINTANPLGMQGRMAQVFASLVREIWSGKFSSVAPYDFKRTIAGFAPQFSGYSQHDSQEFLAFLLDALHEDLNLVQSKPYVENVQAAPGDDDEKVATEAWRRHLLRNKSIIVTLFQGQLKSTVLCSHCQHQSITFDPFMYLTVPIPNADRLRKDFTFVPLDIEAPIMRYSALVPRNGQIKDFRAHVTLLTGVDPRRLSIVELWKSSIWDDFKDDQPISQMDSAEVIVVYELFDSVADISANRNADAPAEVPDIPYVTTLNDDVDAPPPLESSTVPSDTETETVSNIILTTHGKCDFCEREMELRHHTATCPKWTCEGCMSVLNDGTFKCDCVRQSPSVSAIPDVESAVEEADEGLPKSPVPGMVTSPLSNGDSDSYLSEFKRRQPATTINYMWLSSSVPTPSDIWLQISRVDAYDASFVPFLLPYQVISGMTNRELIDYIIENIAEPRLLPEGGILSPGDVALYVSEKRPRCWTRNREDAIPYDDSPFALVQYLNLQLQFDLKDAEEKVVFHESAREKHKEDKKGLNLYELLEAYTTCETLSNDDLYYCSSCKTLRQISKHVELYKLPEILIVHLKRFHYDHIRRNKLDDMVEFPLDELDMCEYLAPSARRRIHCPNHPENQSIPKQRLSSAGLQQEASSMTESTVDNESDAEEERV